MKQWLTILLMVWATAMLQSTGENRSAPCRAEWHVTVLAPENEWPALEDSSPLLATSSPAARQLSGAGHTPCKSVRHSDTVGSGITHSDIANPHIHLPASGNTGHDSCPLSLRGGGRYIYFLRSIII